jgi:uncharacterized membrane protein YphA (DoxX/SURF4 family)
MSPTPHPFRLAPLLATGARLGVAALFLLAAWPKLLDPAAFSTAINNYRLLPPLGSALVGHSLPWLELVTAIALLLPRPRLRQGAWLLATLLSALFLTAQTTAWARGLDISCGCFGTGGKITGFDVFTRFLLLALTFTAYLQVCAPHPSRH